MKKYGFLLAFSAAIVVIGCGGGGGRKSPTDGSTNGNTNSGDSVATANLVITTPPTGRVFVNFLPRQGRAESYTANISRVEIRSGDDAVANPLQNYKFQMNGPFVQGPLINVPTGFGVDSKLFDVYNLVVDSLTFTDNDNNSTVFEGSAGSALIDETFPANIRVFPGRETSVQVYLNEGMIDLTTNPPTFRRDIFELSNLNPVSNKIEGFLGDYVMFDISGLGTSRPDLQEGGAANRVYISGDRVALSAAGPAGRFEVLTQDAGLRLEGDFADPTVVGGNSLTDGSYRLVTPDPNDPNIEDPAKITSVFGSFRRFVDSNNPSRSAFLNVGAFEVLTFPSSEDNAVQTMTALVTNGLGQITDMYIGTAFLDTGTFQLFSLKEYVDGSAINPITGTLSGFTGTGGTAVAVPNEDSGSLVRAGRYSFDTSVLPTGFRQTGRFVVYRA